MITFPPSFRRLLIPLSALLLPIAWAAPSASVAPLANQAFLLDTEHAQWLKPGSELSPVTPQMLPLADADGFADTQRLAPVPPSSGSLAWTLAVAKPGRYRIALEYSHDKSGNDFELRTGTQSIPGSVPGTRRGTQALIELGELNLSVGPQTLELRSTTALDNTFMSVGALYLYPAEQPQLTRPQLGAAIAAHKPRKLPTELRLPAIFSDHLVLQRDQPVPLWGRAQPGTQVTVTFRDQIHSAMADLAGRWRVQLNPLTAGGPFELTITDGTLTKRLTDVLVGEVWFGSGQSNMEVSVKFPKSANPTAPYECDADTKQLIESGVHPEIRISAVTRDHGNNPGWSLLTAENCLDAPALLTSAAILLRQKLQVPVGIIVRAESSSPSSVWLSRDAVEGDPEIQRQLQAYAATDYPQLLAAYPAKVQAWEDAAAKAKADGKTAPVKPNAPALAGHFPFPPYAYSAGRFIYYGANYTSRIEPVAGYAVRGLVWDQGENHTGIAGADQSAVMPALVRSWRAAWGRPELPFFYVRKNQHPETLPAALAALGQTVQIDNRGLGQINHPPDKAAYARRLVEQMERTVYAPSAASPSPDKR